MPVPFETFAPGDHVYVTLPYAGAGYFEPSCPSCGPYTVTRCSWQPDTIRLVKGLHESVEAAEQEALARNKRAGLGWYSYDLMVHAQSIKPFIGPHLPSQRVPW